MKTTPTLATLFALSSLLALPSAAGVRRTAARALNPR